MGDYATEVVFRELERRRRVTQDSINKGKVSKWRHGHDSVNVLDQLSRYKRVVERLESMLEEEHCKRGPHIEGVEAVMWSVRLRKIMRDEGLE